MRRSFRAEDVLTVAHPASTGAATRSLHKSTWLTDDEPAPAGRGKDERRTCQHHQDSGRIIKTFEQIIKSSFRVMDLAMPLHPVDGQAGQDDGWPDCILTSRPIPGAWRPSVAADPNLSAILSASSYPFPTPGRRQRPNASMPGSRAALYGGLHMEAAVPWEEPAAAAAGYDAATSESDSAERSTPDAVVEAPKAKRRRKSRAQGSAEVMDKSSTSEKKVGRPRKAVDTSDCDDPEERRRRQIRLAQRAYRLRKESRISFLEARVSQLETSVDKMSAAVVSFGSKLVESKVLIPHAELRDSLSETVQTCLESVRESSSRGEDEQDMQQLSLQTQAATTTPSVPLELYTAPLPPVDLSLLGPGNGSPAGSGGVLHLKHAEFMEKLHTSIVYYGYSLLADPSTPLELLSRHFRLTLAVMDRTRVLAYFAAALQAKLSRGRITGDWGDMPFFQLGGAGSHYSWLTERDKLMQNQIANGSSKQEEADAASAALALYSRRSRGWPRIAVSPDTLPSDVQDELEGEWFDMQDLELFLRERNTKLFRVDAAGAPTGSTPKPAPRSKGFINAEWLLRTLLHRATCLGRSAGFRRRDVEMALSGVIHS